jgi:hypothetical protein
VSKPIEPIHYESPDGSQSWKVDGKFHRDEGPAIIYKTGTMIWYQHGRLHCETGPAWCWLNGELEWWLQGIQYTELEWRWLVRLIKPSCKG